MSDDIKNDITPPKTGRLAKTGQVGLEVAGGAVPFVGGVLSAASSAWSGNDQERINNFLTHWVEMLRDEILEKEQTILEIAQRLDLQDKKITERMDSSEYQSIMKKAFRDWSAAESNNKREYVRNILANAAATTVVSDDVVKMFLDWLGTYSEFHFQVISAVFNVSGITRGGIWEKLGRDPVREDSADADLYKLLIRDLSIGGIIRQHVERDYYGNPVRQPAVRRPKGSGPKPPVSAFDNNEQYELTELGKQFVHYAMTDLPIKIAANASEPGPDEPSDINGRFESGMEGNP